MSADSTELRERLNLIRSAAKISAERAVALKTRDVPINELHVMTTDELREFVALDETAYKAKYGKTHTPFVPPTKPVMTGGEGDMASMMAAMLQPYLGLNEERVREIAIEEATNAASNFIGKTLDINVTTPAGTVTIKGAHKQADQILFWISQRKHVYLYGPPGGGKTTVARHVATALNREFGYMMLNAMTSPANILGFVGADAKTYRASIFRELYPKEALMCFDELDNCNPNTLTTINGPIENRECQFPDGLVSMHENFAIIGTGNTAGRGGSIMHAGRQALDAATLARFVCIEFEYDLDLEERMVLAAGPKNAQQVLRYIRDVREYVRKNDVKLVVSPREAVNLAIGADFAPFDDEALLNHTIFKGFNPDAVRTLKTNVTPPKFTRV